MESRLIRERISDGIDLNWQAIENTRASVYSRHIHDVYEMIYFIDACSDYVIENRAYPINEGDVILIAPGKYHFLAPVDGKYYERLVIHFTPDAVIDKTLLSAAFNNVEFLPKSDYPEVSLVIKQLLGYCKQTSDEILDVAVKCKLSELLLLASLVNPPKNCSGYAIDDKISADAVAYIADNLRSVNCVDDVASALFLSRSTLQHAFKASMKIPIMQYVRNKKIVAARALIQSGMPLKDVSEAVGFKEYSTFFRLYKSYYGHTPKKEQ